MSLQNLRQEIDAIDADLVALLNRRADISLQVGKQKSAELNARYTATERERDLIDHLTSLHNGGALPIPALTAIYREITDNSPGSGIDAVPEYDSTPSLALRQQFDEIDAEIVGLLNRRAGISVQVGQQKASEPNARYFAPERERDIFERIAILHNGGAFPVSGLISIFREIISSSTALQTSITVAYWGPQGTFTEMAARQRFGSSPKFSECRTIQDVFSEVEHEQADYGVVPVENSTEGVVNYTLDVFSETPLKICAEVYVTIVQNLLTHATSLDQITRLYTGPQPLAQCRHWLDAHLPNVDIIEVMPTSKAAERAADDPEGAAITAKRSSEIYNVPLLFEGIEDNPHNRTRFLVIGRKDSPRTGRDRTSILFAVKNEPGSLGRSLRAFETHGVNLTMIHSRPTKNAAWEYVQFADFQGHEEDAAVKRALDDLRSQAIYVTVLGSYPEG